MHSNLERAAEAHFFYPYVKFYFFVGFLCEVGQTKKKNQKYI